MSVFDPAEFPLAEHDPAALPDADAEAGACPPAGDAEAGVTAAIVSARTKGTTTARVLWNFVFIDTSIFHSMKVVLAWLDRRSTSRAQHGHVP
jgi:hypothetical protein